MSAREILAVSGDPDPASVDTRLLAQAPAVVPPSCTLTLYDGLGELPPFDPTVATTELPPAVVDLRQRLRRAEGLLVSSPPEGDGIAEPMARVLGWASSSGVLIGTRVAVLNTSTVSNAYLAHAALLRALGTLGARIVSWASLSIPVGARGFDDTGALVDPFPAQTFRLAVVMLADAVARRQ